MLPKILVEAERLHEEKRYQEAAPLYDRVLAQNEANPYIVAGLAQTLMHNADALGASIALYHYAIHCFKKANEKIPSALYSNLGLTYKASGQRDKALEWLQRAVEKHETAGTLSNYGQMFVETDTPEKGRALLEKALKLDPSLAMAHWNLSLCLLSQAHKTGEWERAWKEYEWGMVQGGMRVKKTLVDLPEWDGSAGKKVLVYGEQGIGDEIMFASIIPDAMKDVEVILDCHKRLTTLFSKSFGVKCYGTRKEKELDWLEVEKPDAICSIGSLGKFYRKTRESFTGAPYLKAESVPKGSKFRVGISWTGGRLAGRVAKRTVPLSWWDNILRNDCEFVSLQYTEGCEDEIAVVNSKLGHSIRQEPVAKAEDYYELAKYVKSCDLIITCCTSLVHLAGALGVPCWVMVPKSPAWRYQTSGAMPWYRSVRLYRQPANEDGAWLPVVNTVANDLSALLASRMQKAA